MPKLGVILLFHGSRLKEANEDVLKLAELLQDHHNHSEIYTGTAFLQFGRPSLEDAIKKTVSNGCLEIVIAPLFLTSGIHITEDIPEIISRAEKLYPEVKFKQCRPLGCDPRLIPIIWERVEER
jgi:sirohydrochlorin ferrochelatase